MPGGRVVFDSVWKKFRRGERHDSLRDLIPGLLRRGGRMRPALALSDREFWALKAISFEVLPGRALGIIGPNGAGKSTCLKIATKLMRPDAGRAVVTGRAGALIEIAAGFHPDLTGRENIYLQGALMGLGRGHTATRLDEIVEFAGIGPFLDTPVKRYSSGMSARLGFSIAAHMEPDILFIDEVLSVGDMSFQQKCTERMMHFKGEGVAIVFVSHNLQAVARLCDEAILIRQETVAQGETSAVLREYTNLGGRMDLNVPELSLTGYQLVAPGGTLDHLQPGSPLRMTATVEPRCVLRDLTFGLVVHRSTDMVVCYDGNFALSELEVNELEPGRRYTLEFTMTANLVRGLYQVAFHVFHNPSQRFLLRVSPAGNFSVDEYRTWSGIAHLDGRARLTPAAADVLVD